VRLTEHVFESEGQSKRNLKSKSPYLIRMWRFC
jgi:hypothetical protein